MADLTASGLTEPLVPKRFGGQQADFPAILDPVQRMAHGCTSSAWTIGFYFLGSPVQRFKRDVDVISGHVVFDYDTSRELSGACGELKIPRTAIV